MNTKSLALLALAPVLLVQPARAETQKQKPGLVMKVKMACLKLQVAAIKRFGLTKRVKITKGLLSDPKQHTRWYSEGRLVRTKDYVQHGRYAVSGHWATTATRFNADGTVRSVHMVHRERNRPEATTTQRACSLTLVDNEPPSGAFLVKDPGSRWRSAPAPKSGDVMSFEQSFPNNRVAGTLADTYERFDDFLKTL